MEKSTIAGGMFLLTYLSISVYFFCWVYLLPFFPWFSFLFPPLKLGLIIPYTMFLALVVIVGCFTAGLFIRERLYS